VTLDVYSPATRVVHAVAARAFSRTTTVCGSRNYKIRVTDGSGSGSFRLTLAKP
jgi:hypothetical protein